MPGLLKSKRYLPTLTEIVHPHTPQAAPEIDCEELVERLMQRVVPTVEHQIREILQRQVQAQMRLLLPQIQQEIEAVVRQAVVDAMAEKGPSGASV